jgi:hypothetical protein
LIFVCRRSVNCYAKALCDCQLNVARFFLM